MGLKPIFYAMKSKNMSTNKYQKQIDKLDKDKLDNRFFSRSKKEYSFV